MSSCTKPAAPPEDPNAKAKILAQAAAQDWLALLDNGTFDTGWEDMTTAAKSATTKDEWVNATKGVRTPLGAVKNREVMTNKYLDTLEGMPAGAAIVVEFGTTFENKEDAFETVTLQMDGDAWKVARYVTE